MSMTREEAIELLRDTPIDIRSTREDDIHTLYATAQMMATDALRPVSWERVEKVWPGCHVCSGCKLCIWNKTKKCNDCKNRNSFRPLSDFCPRCGKPLTDAAVDMVMERLEALKDGSTTD